MPSAPQRGAIRRVARKIKCSAGAIFLAAGAGGGLTWYYSEAVFAFLFIPAGGSLSPHGGLPIFIAPTEMLSANINLAIKGGIATAFPVLLACTYWITYPLIPPPQRRFVLLFIPASLLCFVGGVAFGYYVMLPTGMRFLLHFGEGIAVPTIRISEYMGLVSSLLFWLGIVFQVPLFMFLLTKLRVVTYRQFRKVRRYVPIAALILGGIITPTFDPVNQALVAGPIVALYEFGLILSWLAEGGHRKVAQVSKAGTVGFLRRIRVVLVMPFTLVLAAAYAAAQQLVFVWDGHLSSTGRSYAQVRLDGLYRRARGPMEIQKSLWFELAVIAALLVIYGVGLWLLVSA